MTCAVAMSEQAAREMEESAAWWAQERSVEQSERWYAGIRHAIMKVAEQPDRYPRAAEDGAFPHPASAPRVALRSRFAANTSGCVCRRGKGKDGEHLRRGIEPVDDRVVLRPERHVGGIDAAIRRHGRPFGKPACEAMGPHPEDTAAPADRPVTRGRNPVKNGRE